MKSDEELGRNVRTAREALGLSQAEVSNRLTELGITGMYPQTITKIEAGARALKLREGLALAQVLQVPAEQLAAADDHGLAHAISLTKAAARADGAFRAIGESTHRLLDEQAVLREWLAKHEHSTGAWQSALGLNPLDAVRRAQAEWEALERADLEGSDDGER